MRASMAAAGGGGSVGAAALEAVMAVEGQEATPSAEGGMRGAGVVEARLAARPRARLCHCLRGMVLASHYARPSMAVDGGACVGDMKTLAKALQCLWPV